MVFEVFFNGLQFFSDCFVLCKFHMTLETESIREGFVNSDGIFFFSLLFNSMYKFFY